MKFLSNILKRAAQPSGSGTAVLPYISLQKYFQLFVGSIHTLTDTPPLTSPAIQVPGHFLKYYGCAEANDFFSAESSFTTTGEFSNDNGGHVYHGEYVTHGKDGGAMEYIYIVIASSEPTEKPRLRNFTPHFVFLGGRMAGDQQEVVYSTFMISRSGYKDEKSFLSTVNQDSMPQVIAALAFADIPFKQVLSGQKPDADINAAAFSMTKTKEHLGKFFSTIETRTAQSLSLGMNT